MGTRRHTRCARAAHLAVIPRLEHTFIGAGRRDDSGRGRRRAAPRPLDPDFHGRRRAFPGAVLPAVSSWRLVRQAHGGQRLGRSHRSLHDGETRHGSRHTGGGFGRGDRHLWRRQSFRRNFCHRANGKGPIQDRRHTTTPDAGGNSPRHHDLHDVRVARYSCPAKCHPDAILRHNALRCPGARHHRGCRHACFRFMVARTGRERSPTRG